jgi:hypothetical protein
MTNDSHNEPNWHKYEPEFLSLFGYKMCLTNCEDEKANDFWYKGSIGVELKTDTYERDTGNFFIERYSYGDVDGGPWAAVKHSRIFIYRFKVYRKIYMFITQQLLKRTLEVKDKYPLIEVPNKSWITRGYPIPIDEYDGLYVYRTEAMLQGEW